MRASLNGSDQPLRPYVENWKRVIDQFQIFSSRPKPVGDFHTAGDRGAREEERLGHREGREARGEDGGAVDAEPRDRRARGDAAERVAAREEPGRATVARRRSRAPPGARGGRPSLDGGRAPRRRARADRRGRRRRRDARDGARGRAVRGAGLARGRDDGQVVARGDGAADGGAEGDEEGPEARVGERVARRRVRPLRRRGRRPAGEERRAAAVVGLAVVGEAVGRAALEPRRGGAAAAREERGAEARDDRGERERRPGPRRAAREARGDGEGDGGDADGERALEASPRGAVRPRERPAAGRRGRVRRRGEREVQRRRRGERGGREAQEGQELLAAEPAAGAGARGVDGPEEARVVELRERDAREAEAGLEAADDVAPPAPETTGGTPRPAKASHLSSSVESTWFPLMFGRLRFLSAGPFQTAALLRRHCTMDIIVKSRCLSSFPARSPARRPRSS